MWMNSDFSSKINMFVLWMIGLLIVVAENNRKSYGLWLICVTHLNVLIIYSLKSGDCRQFAIRTMSAAPTKSIQETWPTTIEHSWNMPYHTSSIFISNHTSETIWNKTKPQYYLQKNKIANSCAFALLGKIRFIQAHHTV